ncbi:hypothetical protein BpHYR1_017335 [Brachionus plicatilis]|uniref:Uncharacterized protein n=1 Tax=Brachionus plicatilis TaxID=10195 RepID=A0A3M7Q1R2_BRAPC|nr:hypothetical protein BpHYR1_017335 [Brachionus plicatilis]
MKQIESTFVSTTAQVYKVINKIFANKLNIFNQILNIGLYEYSQCLEGKKLIFSKQIKTNLCAFCFSTLPLPFLGSSSTYAFPTFPLGRVEEKKESRKN